MIHIQSHLAVKVDVLVEGRCSDLLRMQKSSCPERNCGPSSKSPIQYVGKHWPLEFLWVLAPPIKLK